MDKTLIWLLIPSSLVIFTYLRVSALYKSRNYDLEEYLLAGKHVSRLRFILATTTISLLGVMALSHLGLFYRSGFSYGYAALAAIIVPLLSALFARRLWILSRIFNPLTPAQLLGNYYRSPGMRWITALIAILVALPLTIMSLRFGASLMEGLLLGASSPSSPQNLVMHNSWLVAPVTMVVMTALLYVHSAIGGMGAILKLAAPVGIALVMALILAALVCVDALGGFGDVLEHLNRLQENQTTAPLFQQGGFFDPLPAAAPTNMAWPGMMVATSLLALAGLACAPAALNISLTPAQGQSHAPAQFFAAALMTGLVLLTTTIMIALLVRLKTDMPELGAGSVTNMMGALKAGDEPRTIIALLLATPLGTPTLMGLITLSLLAGLMAAAAAALITAGGIIANDIFYDRLKRSHQLPHRKSITRGTIAALLVLALSISWQKPEDPLPLFLLAGAFGLQLLPALAGLCYFERLSGQAIQEGAVVGVMAVLITSAVPQGLASFFGLTMPFDAWPLSLHPAFWGLAANLGVLFATSVIARAVYSNEKREQMIAHQRTYHVLPDGKPLMAPDAGFWRVIAVLIGILFCVVTALPLTNIVLPDPLPAWMPTLWRWQILSWLIGLALVYVVAYRLQPVFNPEHALNGSLNPQRRRFRVKAQTRKSRRDDHDIEKK